MMVAHAADVASAIFKHIVLSLLLKSQLNLLLHCGKLVGIVSSWQIHGLLSVGCVVSAVGYWQVTSEVSYFWK